MAKKLMRPPVVVLEKTADSLPRIDRWSRDPITEKGLRQIANSVNWDRQKTQFEELKAGQ